MSVVVVLILRGCYLVVLLVYWTFDKLPLSMSSVFTVVSIFLVITLYGAVHFTVIFSHGVIDLSLTASARPISPHNFLKLFFQPGDHSFYGCSNFAVFNRLQRATNSIRTAMCLCKMLIEVFLFFISAAKAITGGFVVTRHLPTFWLHVAL